MSDYLDPLQPEETRLGADNIPEELPPIALGYRGGGGDPIFGFLLALAVSIGLTPVLPASADMRFTLVWGVLASISVLSWLLGSFERITQDTPENLLWGVTFGILLGVPFVLFFFNTFGASARLMFPQMSAGVLLAYLVFVMPLAETLFFRGLLQQSLEFWMVGLLGGIWGILLFFPVMWGEILQAPAVAFFLAVALFTMSMMFSYVRERNSLASAWVCQIVVNVILFFLPYVGSV